MLFAGKLAHRFKNEGAKVGLFTLHLLVQLYIASSHSCTIRKFMFLLSTLIQVLMAAGDTFRAAARDQLEVWAERTGSEIVIDKDKKAQAPSGMKF
jgi:signal recognition particle GTPase